MTTTPSNDSPGSRSHSLVLSEGEFGIGVFTDSFAFPNATDLHMVDGGALTSTPSFTSYLYGNALLLGMLQSPLSDRLATVGALTARYGNTVVVIESVERFSVPYLGELISDDVVLRRQGGLVVGRDQTLGLGDGHDHSVSTLSGVDLLAEWPQITTFYRRTRPWDAFSEWRFSQYLASFKAPSRFEQVRWHIAHDRNQIVGAAGSFWRGECGGLQELLVVDSHRRRGIASGIIQEAINRARGPAPAVIAVAERFSAAEEFYRSIGFGEASFQQWVRVTA